MFTKQGHDRYLSGFRRAAASLGTAPEYLTSPAAKSHGAAAPDLRPAPRVGVPKSASHLPRSAEFSVHALGFGIRRDVA